MRNPTISDVAKAVGVSTKTVSRVLNNEPFVRAEVRDRVKAAALAMNYQVNVMALSLITRRHHLIGLTYERPSSTYVVNLQQGVLARLEQERYRLIVLPFDQTQTNPDGLIAFLLGTSLDGVILAPPASDNQRVLDALDAAHLPYARIAPGHDVHRGASTTMDDGGAAREIADHVLDLGHTRCAVILGDPGHHATGARLAGIRAAFDARGIDFASVRIENGDFTADSGERAMRRMLADGVRPTAVLALNDDMALGAINALRDTGLAVPGDVSVTGFDDSDICSLCSPALTTVRQPVAEMAIDATDKLLRLLAGEAAGPITTQPHRLVIRQSTASPSVPQMRG